MKHLKLFESFNRINELNVGDMVYVDMYGPRTLGFSSGGSTMRRNMAFRPRMDQHYDFDQNTKYEIVNIEGGMATLFDDNNEPLDVSTNKLHSEKIEMDYIKDCLTSSFEDLFDINRCEYKQYINEIIININQEIECVPFDTIYNNEFKPRLQADGFSCSRDFSTVQETPDPIAHQTQIVVRKSN